MLTFLTILQLFTFVTCRLFRLSASIRDAAFIRSLILMVMGFVFGAEAT